MGVLMGGKQQGQGPFSKQAENMAYSFMKGSNKSRKLVFQQLKEALATGNIEARMPIIQSAVEQGLQQGSQNLRAAESSIATMPGVGRTPYAQEALVANRATAQQAVAQIPSEVIGQTVMNAPNTITAANQAAMQLMGVAQQGEALQQAAKAQNYAYKMSLIGGIVNGIVGNVRQYAGAYGGGGGAGGGG